MYIKKVNDFINDLNSSNIEEFKPQLKKYMIELMLSAKNDSDMSLEELEGMLDLKIMKEEFQSEIEVELNEEGLKLGALTDEFMNIYINFTKGMAERGYIKSSIDLSRKVLKALGWQYRDVYLVKKNNGLNEKGVTYLTSKKYLKDLEECIEKRLNEDINNISKECINILGLVEYIKNELENELDNNSDSIIFGLRNKSLEEFHKENHIPEYKCIFTHEYVKELKQRKYEWSSLSFKLKTNYYMDELYSDLD